MRGEQLDCPLAGSNSSSGSRCLKKTAFLDKPEGSKGEEKNL